MRKRPGSMEDVRLPLKQARRPRPSRVKGDTPQPRMPAERLALCLELSDFCLELREAARRTSRS